MFFTGYWPRKGDEAHWTHVKVETLIYSHSSSSPVFIQGSLIILLIPFTAGPKNLDDLVKLLDVLDKRFAAAKEMQQEMQSAIDKIKDELKDVKLKINGSKILCDSRFMLLCHLGKKCEETKEENSFIGQIFYKS